MIYKLSRYRLLYFMTVRYSAHVMVVKVLLIKLLKQYLLIIWWNLPSLYFRFNILLSEFHIISYFGLGHPPMHYSITYF